MASVKQERVMGKFTREEVSEHSSREDLWIIIDDKVFDLTKFLKVHPGMQQPLIEWAGKDATEVFYSQHRKSVLFKYMPQLCIGEIVDGIKTRTPKKELISPILFTELNHWHGLNSPYYTEHHKEFQTTVRSWLRENLQAELERHEVSGKQLKRSIYEKAGKIGLLAMKAGVHKMAPKIRCFGYKGKDLDYFHEAILHQETSALNCPGAIDGLTGGILIGVPPVILSQNMALIKEIAAPVLMGKKLACLAITEPYVGSDVANLRTTAVLSEDGEYYIVNGIKKWITGGMNADYFTTAVRTGGAGARGVSCLCIPRECGVRTKKIKVASYSPCAATCYVEFDDCKVPKKYLLGKENQGFRLVMANFNHERWVIAVGTIGGMRCVIDECIRWANQRMVFGKPLIKEPVIRGKIGYMIARLEACQQMCDNVTYQFNTMNHKQHYKYLGGPVSLLKVATTNMGEFVTSEACQIFGGRGITHNGMGTVINRSRMQIKNSTIYGGAEEVMADLGVRQALKSMRGLDVKL